METCHYDAHLSIYGMGDAPSFVIKGDAPAIVMGDEMGDMPAIVIKGDAPAFMMGDRMGDAPAFMIKGNASLATRVFFTCKIGEAQ
jgi:hypothetical protein